MKWKHGKTTCMEYLRNRKIAVTGFLSMLFLFSAPIHSESVYQEYLEAWLQQDTELSLSRQAYELEILKEQFHNQEIDSVFRTGLGQGAGSSGFSIMLGENGEPSQVSFTPYMGYSFGENNSSTIQLDLQGTLVNGDSADNSDETVNVDGRQEETGSSIAASLSFQHLLEDILSHDTTDPESFRIAISLEQALKNFQDEILNSEIRFLDEIDGIYSLYSQMDDLLHTMENREESRRNLIQVQGYREDSSEVAKIDLNIEQIQGEISAVQGKLEHAAQFLEDILKKTIDRTVLNAIFQEFGQIDSSIITLPELEDLAAIRFQSLNERAAQLELQNSREKDPANINLSAAVSPRINTQDGSVSTGASAGVQMDISGELSSGLDFTYDGQNNSSTLSFSLSYSSDPQRTRNQLEVQQLENQLRREELISQRTIVQQRQNLHGLEAEILQLKNELQNGIRELSVKNQEIRESEQGVEKGINDSDELQDLKHQAIQLESSILSTRISIYQKALEIRAMKSGAAQ